MRDFGGKGCRECSDFLCGMMRVGVGREASVYVRASMCMSVCMYVCAYVDSLW